MVLFDVVPWNSEFFRMPVGSTACCPSLCPPDADLGRFAAAEMPVVLVDYPHERLPDHLNDVAGYRDTLVPAGSATAGSPSSATTVLYGFTSACSGRGTPREALCEAGLGRFGFVRRASHRREPAAVLTRELLDLANPPTAIFAASDLDGRARG